MADWFRGPSEAPNALVPSRRGYARSRVFRFAAILALLVVCGAGAWLALLMLAGRTPAEVGLGGEHFAIGDDVKTGFGVVAVEHAAALTGLSDRDLTGAHGVAGLVQAGAIDVQASVVISNQRDSVLRYRPEQFELLDGRGNKIPLSRVPDLPGELQPHAAIDMQLDFVTTTNARPFTIRFVGSNGQARLIDLGDVGCTLQSGSGARLPTSRGCQKAAPEHHH